MAKELLNHGIVKRVINNKRFAFMYDVYQYESFMRNCICYELRIDFLISNNKDWTSYILIDNVKIDIPDHWAKNTMLEIEIHNFIKKCAETIDKLEKDGII